MSGDDDVILDRARNTEALLDYVENHVADVMADWGAILVEEVADANGIATDAALRERVLRTLSPRALDLRPGRTQDEVLRAILATRREGVWGRVIDEFITRKELNAPRHEERRLMIEALEELRIDPGNPAAPDATRDHTVARIYGEFVGSAAGSDPIALTSPPNRITPWNFRVRRFGHAQGRRINRERILAAGALSWCYEVGERMGVYALADALVYRWWVGEEDFADQNLSNELYRYWKLREQRPSAEERALLFRRVFALGEGQVSERVVVNEAFPNLWHNLMEEISLYVSKSESSFSNDQVSRAGVYQAASELQANLSQHMAGMAILHVTEMYNQLRAERSEAGFLGALDVLEHEEVMARFAKGAELDVAPVVQALASEEFGVSPNVTSIGTSADEGLLIFEWLADYQPGQTDDQAFSELITHGKAWVLAQKAAGQGLLASTSTGSGRTAPDEEESWEEDGWDGQHWDTRESQANFDDEEAFR
ncbi:hypothetical protein [Ornithinimicrobium sufpigmenti]|uniref:hypothetical protein n=1 Tax=Ornithinimicrobium sufpigmenti TaxID=2508882 RepID=UPI00103658EE|nr:MULTISPECIES: hypothetical protein [unclassified Ornithinimicrobium]